MPIEGKLGSLYVDKEQTQPLFPRTKTKAITDDDNIRLDITLDSLKTTVNSKASEAFVMNAIANAQLGGGEGDIDLSGYATKDDISILATKEELNTIDFPVDSVNGKMGAVQLNADDIGARPNTWLPTIAEIGAAPAGWGYGGAMDYIVDESGTFETKLNEIMAGMVNHSVKQFSFYDTKDLHATKFYGRLWKYTPNYATLEAVNYNGNKAVKCRRAGTWQPWEWENPPMADGVEYRTTKRYDGKPVYTTCLNLGTLPASGDKNFKYANSSDTTELISFKIFSKNSQNEQYLWPHIVYTSAEIKGTCRQSGNRTFSIRAIQNLSTFTGKAILEYIKV